MDLAKHEHKEIWAIWKGLVIKMNICIYIYIYIYIYMQYVNYIYICILYVLYIYVYIINFSILPHVFVNLIIRNLFEPSIIPLNVAFKILSCILLTVKLLGTVHNFMKILVHKCVGSLFKYSQYNFVKNIYSKFP